MHITRSKKERTRKMGHTAIPHHEECHEGVAGLISAMLKEEDDRHSDTAAVMRCCVLPIYTKLDYYASI